MTDDVVPITLEERLSRIQKAQRLHKLMIIGTDLRVWEEHESPYRQIALALKDRGIHSGNEIEVNFGQASAFPHGSIQPQHLKKGNIVLVDGGCKVQGYASDISRTIVFGAAPTRRQREVWDIGKKAQAAGFAAARL